MTTKATRPASTGIPSAIARITPKPLIAQNAPIPILIRGRAEGVAICSIHHSTYPIDPIRAKTRRKAIGQGKCSPHSTKTTNTIVQKATRPMFIRGLYFLFEVGVSGVSDASSPSKISSGSPSAFTISTQCFWLILPSIAPSFSSMPERTSS